MNLARYTSEELIELHLPLPEKPPDNPDLNLQKWRQRQKENYLEYFVSILERSGKVLHRRKLLTDFINRERQMSTALEGGVAVPHVRSRYIREVVLGFARSLEGIHFDAIDGGLTHLFFIIASPSHIADLHIKIYRQIAAMFRYGTAYDELMTLTHPGEVLRILRQID